MKKRYILLLLLSHLYLYPGLFGQGSTTIPEGSLVTHPKQYFIKLCHGISNQEVQALMSELNSVELWKNDRIGLRLWAVKQFPYSCSDGNITDIEEHLTRSQKKTSVDDITLDMVFKLEESGSGNGSNSYFEALDLHADLGPKPIRIAILDSGISDQAISSNSDYAGLKSYTGYDYIDNDLIPDDQNGHGTHIAGLIYRIISRSGSSANISFDIRKTHDENGLGNISNLISAIIDAVDAGANVINMSFSYYEMLNNEELNPLQLAIEYAEQKGVLIVASAGNLFRNNDHSEAVPVPASLPNENILSVASNNPNESLSYFSNYGSNSVDVSILGESIPGLSRSGELKYASGTSFSTAIVTAMSAILGTRQDQFNGCAIKCMLIRTSKVLPGWQSLDRAGGIIDFKKAIQNPPAECSALCPNIPPDTDIDCGANCAPVTDHMYICVGAGITVVDKLLVYDSENDVITFTPNAVYGPFKGSVVINPDGAFAYTSTNGEPDMFVYQVCDNHQEVCSDGCNQGVVYINSAGCQSPSKGGGYYETSSARISSGNDDAEENADNGTMYLNSTDLEMTADPSNFRKQIVGMRFDHIKIPREATIESAVIHFMAEDNDATPVSLLFRGENTDKAEGFKSANRNISSRPVTSAAVSWDNLPGWSAGTRYTTPDLSAIIQEIVNRPGWAPDNSLAIIVTGAGKRSAWSYDGDHDRAPELVITFTVPSTEKAEDNCVKATGENPKMLTFRYTGQSCAASRHAQDPNKVTCTGDPASAPFVYITAVGDNDKFYLVNHKVALGGIFSVDAAGLGDDKLKSSTTIYLKDAQGRILQTVKLETSGSQPLRVNDQFAALTLEGYLSKTNLTCGNPDLENRQVYDCVKDTGGNPRLLTFRYTGQNCGASNFAQDPKKVECSGDPRFFPTVFITAIGDNDKFYLVNREVALNETFTIDAARVGENKLKSTTTIYLKHATGKLLQTIKLQTSGSEPLGLKNQFASLVLVGYMAENGRICGKPKIPADGDCCEKTGKKPRILTWKYTGEDCTATTHNQNPAEVSCTGDPGFAPFVYVTVESDDTKRKIFFKDLQVPINGVFDVDAMSIDEKKFPNAVTIYLKDAAGSVLQVLNFLTNCSEPLGVGNQFGALRLEGYQAENGEHCGSLPVSKVCDPVANCQVAGKRSAIAVMYLGSAETTVEAFANTGGKDYLGTYGRVGPGDFIVFSSLYQNKSYLGRFFLRWSGREIEIPVETSVEALGKVYGDFKVVQQLDQEGNDCQITYSSCIEVNRICGDKDKSALQAAATMRTEPISLDGALKPLDREKEFGMYPNPTRDVVYLNLQDYSGQAVEIGIYDSVSRLLKRISVDQAAGYPLELALGNLPNGVYYVVAHPEMDRPVTKKLVITRH